MQRRLYFHAQIYAWYSKWGRLKILEIWVSEVVLEGITIVGKSLREHFEVINHKEAIDYVEAIVQGLDGLSEWQIKSIQHLVLKNIDSKNAGIYRQENVVIAGAEHLPPHFLKVPEAMTALIDGYQKTGQVHAVECAARLHVDFVGIHPFVDGKGRTSRLLMNFELMRRGYLPVIISVEQRLSYYEALDTAHTRGDYAPFIGLVADLEQATLKRYLRVILGDA